MIVTLHQPEHLPWLGYFHKMAQADLYVYVDNVQYRKQYFQNRNRVRGAQGAVWVGVPVLKECHRHGPLKDVRIDNSRDWRTTYWGSIEHNYRRHPYFNRYAERLWTIVMSPRERLLDLNYELIDFFRGELGIDTPTIKASELDATGAKTDLIHMVCLRVGARTYLSGPSGQDYLDERPFREVGIDVRYHAFEHPVYPQLRRPTFTPCLSTLDLLMHEGPRAAEILLADLPARPMARTAA